MALILTTLMPKTKIRKGILNLPISQWRKIHAMTNESFIDISVEEFYDLLGCSGGMFLSGKANGLELQFICDLYEYSRNK